MTRYTIYIDGGGNGDIGSVFIRDGEEIFRRIKYRNIPTNNEAEYIALIDALSYFVTKYMDDAESLTVKSDSKLMVCQITRRPDGKFKYRTTADNLILLQQKVLDIIEKINMELDINTIIKWVSRGKNLAGRMLESRKKEGKKNGK